MVTLKHQGLPKLHTWLYTDFSHTSLKMGVECLMPLESLLHIFLCIWMVQKHREQVWKVTCVISHQNSKVLFNNPAFWKSLHAAYRTLIILLT